MEKNEKYQESPFKYREPIIRWLDYGRRSWQRLGFIKIISPQASPSYSTTLEGITKSLVTVVTRLEQIPDEIRDEVLSYVKTHRYNRYKNDRDLSRVELQDLYLSSPILPSSTGAITGDIETAGYGHTVYVEVPTWCVNLRIIRSDNYTLTDRGKALNALTGINNNVLRNYSHEINPMLLSPSEKYFFLYCIFDSDGDLVRDVYASLISEGSSNQFSREYVSIKIAEVLRKIASSRINKATSGVAMKLGQRMGSTIASIENKGKSPKEHFSTPRTEPLVDCGLLQKPVRTDYLYSLPARSIEFFETLRNSKSVGHFIETQLAYYTSYLLGITMDSSSILDERVANYASKHLAQSYLTLRSGLGYCSIREVAVLTTSKIFGEHLYLIEIFDIEKLIWNLAQEYKRAIRFTRSRQGDLSLMRMDLKLVKELLGGE
jgi:hypothetical protein